MTLIGLYGAGGFGREVMPIFRADFVRQNSGEEVKFSFVETEPSNTLCQGLKILSEVDFLLNEEKKFFNVAIADSHARKEISIRLKTFGIKALSIVSNTVIIYPESTVGEGAILMDHTMITDNVKIGKFFHANIYSYIAHDCTVGDYVTFAPRVSCNGNTIIGDHVYIGTGAVIKPGTKNRPRIIGEGSIIGMGAVVTRDVEPFTTVWGNPAQNLPGNGNQKKGGA